MARFDNSIAVAKRLIKKNGQLVQWRSLSNGALPDPNKPWRPGPNAPVDHNVFVCFVSAQTADDVKAFQYVQGRDIMIGKTYGMMAGGIYFEPTSHDVIVRGGKELRINWLDVLQPNEQKVLFTFELVS